MCRVRVPLSTPARREVARHLQTAQPLGHRRPGKGRRALLAVMDGQSFAEGALVLRVPEKTVAAWGRLVCGDGLEGAPPQKPTGRPPQLPPRQNKALATLLAAGPVTAGGSAAGWRSPLPQPLLDDRFGVFDTVFYISQVLKELGLRSQKAAVVSAHRDAGKRDEGCPTTWPPILRLPNERKALLLLGDAASLPPWGPLTDTWARRGPPPKGQTCGKRTGDTGLGGSDYFTGRLLSHGQDGRRNAAAYLRVLTRVEERCR